MTGGSWRLSVGLKVRGRKQPLNAAAAAPLTLARGLVQSLDFGTGSGTLSLAVAQVRSLGAGASETLDLYAGTDLADLYGDAAPFRVVRAFALWVVSGGDAAGLTVGNAGADPLPLFFGAGAHTETVYPGGVPVLGGSPAGVAVTSTARNLKVANNGAVAADYLIALAGSPVSSGMAMGPMGLTYP